MESKESAGEPPTGTTATRPRKARPFSASLDKFLFLVVAVLLLFTIVLLTANLVFQQRNYNAAIFAALGSTEIDHSAVIAYARAWNFAVAEISSIFLAFCLIMVGALYVLRAATASYSFTVANKAQKSSLETGSPGLVMITLGVVLMAVVMLSPSKVDYKSVSNSSMRDEPPPIPAEDGITSSERERKTRETTKPTDK